MKLHLPLSLRRVLLLLSVCGSFSDTVSGATMHSDVSIVTYTDFGQNTGRFVAGETNALLQYIRERDRGIVISYTGGQADYVIPLEQGMVDFSSASYLSTAAAISPSMILTVGHNAEISADFASEAPGIGSEHAVKYTAIGSRSSDVFSNYVYSNPVPDWRVTRQSKIFTDVTPATVCESDAEALRLANSGLFYHVGSGIQQQSGSSWSVGSYNFSSGGIADPTYVVNNPNGKGGVYVNTAYDSTSSGVNAANPLPFAVNSGDSGSPVYVYDGEQYKLWGSVTGMSATSSIYNSYTAKYNEVMNRYNLGVELDADSQVEGVHTAYLGGVTRQGERVVDNAGLSGTKWYGTVQVGTQTQLFCGVRSGLNTWADLSDLKDTQNWYAYSGRLNLGVSELFFTQNLQFSSSASENRIVLDDTVDLGIGYAEFSAAGEGQKVKYTLVSREGESHLFNSAGFVVNENVSLHLQLTNPTDYMREWRKTGAGDLYIEGSGNNNILLNLGGSGTTVLARERGYAAYNVLANNGTTVVINSVGQIARDFTFGNGGGTLDMNGNSMDWYTTNTHVEAAGFSINALTEEAVITNSSRSDVTLTFREGGDRRFVGSFRDADSAGALKIDYQGGGTWTLNGVRTDLSNNSASGLTVSKGTVVLCGTNTIHAVGSDMPASSGRYVHEDDWHYADASMNVNVANNATFELGSHARLTGTVTVHDGGTYIMREGVRHGVEYVEGGLNPEDTTQYRAFFGHKGNTVLGQNATLQIAFSVGTDAENVYAGDISGMGSMTVDTADGTLVLSGNNAAFTGTRELTNGRLVFETIAAAGNTDTNKWLIGEQGTVVARHLTANEVLGVLDTRSSGTLELVADQMTKLDTSRHAAMFLGVAEGSTVQYGEAGTSETLAAVNGQWRLGGGGNLVVNYSLSEDAELVLGRGTVTLAGSGNSFSQLSSVSGGATLLFADSAAARHVQLSGGYGVRLREQSVLASDFRGVLQLSDAAADVDVSSHPALALGADGDMTLTGNITLATGQTLRFGGITGTLVVDSAVGGARDLLVDNQGFEGGTLVLNNLSGLTGKVTVQGYDPQQASSDTGKVTLELNADGVLNSARAVELKDGGTLELAGTRQVFNSQFISESGSAVTDRSESATGAVTFNLSSSDTLDIRGSIDAAATITGGRVITHSPEGLLRSVDGRDAAILELQWDGAHTVNGSSYTNLAELHVASGSVTANGKIDASVIRVDSGARYSTGSSHAAAFIIGGHGAENAAGKGALSMAGNVTMSGGVTMTSDATMNVDSGWSATISGAVDAAGHALTKTGAGTLSLTGGLSRVDSFTVEEGKLSVSTYDAGTGAIHLYGGGELAIGNAASANSLEKHIHDGGTLNLTYSSEVTGKVTGNGLLKINSSVGGAYCNVWSSRHDGYDGVLAVEYSGQYFQIAPGCNSDYTGGTTLNVSGFTEVFAERAFGMGEVNQTKGTLRLYGSNLSVDSVRGTGTLNLNNRTLTLTGELSAATHQAAYAGSLAGGGTLVKKGAYTQLFTTSGNVSLSSVSLAEGTLDFTQSSSLSVGTLNVAAGSTLGVGGSGTVRISSSAVLNGRVDLTNRAWSAGTGVVTVGENASVSIGSGASFVVSGLQEGKTYSLFDLSASGAALSGWERLSAASFELVNCQGHEGGITVLSNGQFCYSGSVQYHDMVWNAGSSGEWNTSASNWKRGSDASIQSFAMSDSVRFAAGQYVVSQTSDIAVTSLALERGASLNLLNENGYAFAASSISLSDASFTTSQTSLASSLILGEADAASRVELGFSGDSLALSGSVSIEDNTTLSVKGTGTLSFNSAFNKLEALELQSGVSMDTNSAALSTHLVLNGGNATLSGDRKMSGNITVNSGSVLTAGGSSDDTLVYNEASGDYTRLLTINKGGELALGNRRWSFGNDASGRDGSVYKIQLNGGLISGNGTGNGNLDFFDNGMIEATGTTGSISAEIRARNSGTAVDVNVIGEDDMLTISGKIIGNGGITKTGTGVLVLTNANNSYTGTTTVKEGILRAASTAALGSSALVVEKGATLSVSDSSLAGYAAANLSGEGTIELNLSATYGNTVNLGTAFKGETYVTNGHFTVTSAVVGETLRLAHGVNMQSGATATVAANLILEGETTVHANYDKHITYSGSVTGDNGVYVSQASSSHTFNGTVDLKEFRTASGAAVNFNGSTTLDKASISQATVTFAGKTAVTEATISGGTANLNGTATLASLTQTGGKVNANGTVEVTGKATGTGGTLGLQSGELKLSYSKADGNTVNLLDGSMGGTAAGALRVAKDASVTVAGQIWGRKDSTVILEQGALLVSTEDAVKVSNRGAAEASFRTAKTVNDAEYSTNSTNWELTNVHLASTASGNKTLTNKLVNSSVENVGSGKLTVSNSANSITDVYATSGNIDIEQLNAAVNLNLAELTVTDSKTVGLYSGSGNSRVEANVTVTSRAEFGKWAVLNANLTLASGSTLCVGEGGLAMGSTLTLQKGITLDDATVQRVHSLGVGESVSLFTGVDGLMLDETRYTSLTVEDSLLASPFFTNLNSNNYLLTYSGTDNGTLAIVAASVPEPTTTTLSLLALTALSLRRRRK